MGGGIIRQIGDHLERAAQAAEIEFQRVFLEKLEILAGTEPPAQRVAQFRVDFQRRQPVGPVQEILGQDALPGTDFEDAFARSNVGPLDDFPGDGRIGQEVLTQGPLLHGDASEGLHRAAAVRNAVWRLSTEAVPFPARS